MGGEPRCSRLDNRFSTMTEVRRVAWPRYEKPEWSDRAFLQGIAGTLELFHLSILRFQNMVSETTGYSVPVYQRIDQAGQRLPLKVKSCRTPTLCWCSVSTTWSRNRKPAPDEIEAVRNFLKREGTCLIIGPHHDVGSSADLQERDHGIRASRRSPGSAATALRNVHPHSDEGARRSGGEPLGLRPAVVPGTRQIAPLTAMRDLDTRGWLTGVTTFNFHPHLPHYALTSEGDKIDQGFGTPADRSVETAPVYRRRKSRVQMPSSGCRQTARAQGTSCSSTYHLHDAIRRHRQLGQLLEEPSHQGLTYLRIGAAMLARSYS